MGERGLTISKNLKEIDPSYPFNKSDLLGHNLIKIFHLFPVSISVNELIISVDDKKKKNLKKR